MAKSHRRESTTRPNTDHNSNKRDVKAKITSLSHIPIGDSITHGRSGIAVRYPDKVFSHLHDMIVARYPNVKQFADLLHLPFDVIEYSRGCGGAEIRVSNDVSYSIEELMGMILKYASNLVEFHSKVTVKDAMISIPPYFGQAERSALLRAEEMLGINVILLINEHSRATLQYGIDKDFSNKTRHLIFYDMVS